MIEKIHGGDIYSKDILYDFSANINPLGVPESVKKAVVENLAVIEKYPDINCTQLKKAISAFENVSDENIVCGNGASDLIYRIVQTIRPKKALLIAPTFAEYEKALKTFGCDIRCFHLDERNNFELDEKILDYLCGIDIFFICNPNNPIGNIVHKNLMEKIIKRCCDEKIYLIADECFMDFVNESQQYKTDIGCKNIIVLKAFTKIFAMAGLRLGYCLCGDVDLCNKIENCGQCWSVSSIAQLTGIVALKEKVFLSQTVEYVENERNFLIAHLKKFGFQVYNSCANFVFFKTDLPLEKLLMQHQIAIRNCDNYRNLDRGYFRIAVRTHTENEIFINTVERILKHGEVNHDTGNNV